jgi:prepilin-type N-terminal cleavage/methylation domain-containing protein
MYYKIYTKKGFTIIECLVSLFVLAIMFAAGIAIYFYSQAALDQAVDRRTALENANSELENLKNNGYTALAGAVSCSSGNSDLWAGPDNVTIAGITGQRSVFICDGGAYKRVRVEVAWRQPDKSSPETVALTSIIAQP